VTRYDINTLRGHPRLVFENFVCVSGRCRRSWRQQGVVVVVVVVVSAHRSRLGRGIVHVIGGLSRGRVGILRAPPAYDFRSAPATPDGVCACLFRSFL